MRTATVVDMGSAELKQVAVPVTSPDLRRMLLAYTVSTVGTLLGSGVVLWIAITQVGVSGGELGLLSGMATLAAGATALVVAPRIDTWHKRPVMITLDLLAGAALLSLCLATWAGKVTVWHLTAVAATAMSVAILFAAASTSMLKHVGRDRLDWALGRQESVFWAAQLIGPPAGGVVTSAIGASLTLACNSASFLLSAILLAGISEPGPAAERASTGLRVGAGLRTIWRLPSLRALYVNAVLFGSALMATNPILALFIVHDLGLSAWEYGLTLGVPCLGGMLAGTLSYRLIRRWGRDRVLLGTGLVRVVWLLPLAAIPAGPAALAAILTLQFGLLFTTGLFNPTFASTRMSVTPADRLSSVVGSWAATTRLVHPIAIGSVGLLAEILGVRAALAIGTGLGALSVLPLLSRSFRDRSGQDANGAGAITERYGGPGSVPSPSAATPALYRKLSQYGVGLARGTRQQ
ncbi:Predicted arabinose efflux permease, MFS family [Micromonospora pallida]|uniref:Predicted arabinose efflux permease, MFS family n=1 Tax=Micromonospora pallida TaxID=145854 RepID=A0A1C6RVB4_9ACTN|nr:MFS transporter [Micromonospora pallida]SCL21105.1 Predicted arabinose efflux permease, MFS family [Micromonospora pallida]